MDPRSTISRPTYMIVLPLCRHEALMLARYVRWLHTGWPAGTVERLPEVRADGTTAVPGVRIVGDLTGIPLLKLAADSGARAVQAIVEEAGFADRKREEGLHDLAIVGG